MSIRRYEIIDEYSGILCGIFTFDENINKVYIKIKEYNDSNTLPMFFQLCVEKGLVELDDTWTRKWIGMRVMPSGRHALGWHLREMGMDHYDEIAILLYNKGRCVMDKCYLKEITSEDVS